MLNRFFRLVEYKVNKIFYYWRKEPFYLVFIRCIIASLESLVEMYRKYLSFRLRKRYKDKLPIIKLFDGSVVTTNVLDEGISLDLFYCGIREQLSIDYLLSNVNKDDVFYDIGANLGYYTVTVAKRVREVISFEPYSRSYELLKRNVILNNLKNTKVYKLGIGEKTQKRLLWVPSKNNQASFYEEASENKKDMIQETSSIVSLDYFVENFKELLPSWIKMDTEGYEYFIIKGAINILRDYKPRIFMELHGNKLSSGRLKELISILLDLGYKIDNCVIETQKAFILPFLNKNIEKLYYYIYRNILKEKDITLSYLYDNELFLKQHIGAIEIFLSCMK